jgi:hypothetical protein
MHGDGITLYRVKTFIRSKTTGKYLESSSSWTNDLAQALGFADTLAVISAVQIHKLVGVEMVILMADKPGNYDVVIGLTDFQGPRPTLGAGASLGTSEPP